MSRLGFEMAYCTRLLTSGDKALRMNPSQKEGGSHFRGQLENWEEIPRKDDSRETLEGFLFFIFGRWAKMRRPIFLSDRGRKMTIAFLRIRNKRLCLHFFQVHNAERRQLWMVGV
jgi:hypothetical protein